jgi:hypothetical protein
MKRILIILLILIALASGWWYAEECDYWNTNYRRLTKEQADIFDFDTYNNGEKLQQVFKEHFGDTSFNFPRQQVQKIKLYKNKPIISSLTSKELSTKDIEDLLSFCNNPDNFGWGETTWGYKDAQYIFRFFDKRNKIVGKLYICLDNCYHIESIPFTPNMKFGQITQTGFQQLKKLIKKYN